MNVHSEEQLRSALNRVRDDIRDWRNERGLDVDGLDDLTLARHVAGDLTETECDALRSKLSQRPALSELMTKVDHVLEARTWKDERPPSSLVLCPPRVPRTIKAAKDNQKVNERAVRNATLENVEFQDTRGKTRKRRWRLLASLAASLMVVATANMFYNRNLHIELLENMHSLNFSQKDIGEGRSAHDSWKEIYAIGATADSKNLVSVESSSGKYFLRIRNLESGENVRTVIIRDSRPATAIALSANATRLVTASLDSVSLDNVLTVWDLEGQEELQTTSSPSSHIVESDLVTALAVTVDGTRAVSGSVDGTLRVWDLENGEELHALTGHLNSVSAVAITPDGIRAISGSLDDGALRVWDLENGEELHALTGHLNSVSAVAITPDGTRAISGSLDDGALNVWDLSSGKMLRTFFGPSVSVSAIAITPDARRVVCVWQDSTLKIWDFRTGELIAPLREKGSDTDMGKQKSMTGTSP